MNYSEKNVQRRAVKLRSKWVRRGKKTQVILLRLFFLVILAGLIYGGYLSYRYLGNVISEVPDVKTVELIPKGVPTQMYDKTGEVIQVLNSGDIKRDYVLLDDVPTDLQNAFISVEDPKFWSHEGINTTEILRSFISGVLNGGRFSQRTSTITQQLLKNQVLSGEEGKNIISSFNSKLKQLYLALSMENRYSKEEIFEYYLNTISLGQGTLGVEAASKRYFNKHVSELTLAECACLAGIAKNPTSYNPIAHSAKNRTREITVLTAMQEQGLITSDQYETALEDNVQNRVLKYNEEYISSIGATSYFVDALTQSVIEDLKSELGYTETQAVNAIYTGGLKVYSTQDLSMQKICDKVINDPSNYPVDVKYQLDYQLVVRHDTGKQDSYNFSDIKKWYAERDDEEIPVLFDDEKEVKKVIKPFRRSMVLSNDRVVSESVRLIVQPQTSFVLMDQKNGEVKALVGGRGDRAVSLSVNRATDSLKQPGTALTTLSTYLPALDTSGLSMGTVSDDSEFYYPGTEDIVKNADGGSYRGLVTLREAMLNSINVIAVKTLDQVTPKVGYDYLRNLGFSSLVDGYSDDTGEMYTDIALPLALGKLTRGVSNEELTGAYASIANGGVYHTPHLYTKITDHDGKTLIDHTDLPSSRVMKESTAWLLTDAMRDVVTNMNAKTIEFRRSEMAIAGKTGTTENKNDMWFVGYTPYLTAGIWCGNDVGKKQKNDSYHKEIWRKIMEQVNSQYDTKDIFPAPLGLVSANICTKCGKLAIDGLCSQASGGSTARMEFFTPDTVPTEMCDCHVRCRICKTSGKLAGDGCPEEDVYEVVYLMKKDEKAGEGKTMDSTLIMPDYLIDSICEEHNSGKH